MSFSAPFSVAIARTRQFFRAMPVRVGTLPGVLAAGATMAPPGYVDSTGAYLLDQLPAPECRRGQFRRAPQAEKTSGRGPRN
jgi:hypothetical protein